jgi:uncharacterized phiE125 gp8 family phage protein
MHINLVESPAIEPLSLIEVKRHLRISQDADDASLMHMISTARQVVESFTQNALITQTYECSQFVSGVYRAQLAYGPVQEFEWVKLGNRVMNKDKYPITRAGNVYFISDIDYLHGDLHVRYKAGYGDDAADVPPTIRMALLMMVSYLYEHRGDAHAPVPTQVKELLQPFRRFGL